MKCSICGKYFTWEDYLERFQDLSLDINEVSVQFCPACIEKTLNERNLLYNSLKTNREESIFLRPDIPNFQRDFSFPQSPSISKEEIMRKTVSFFFWLLTIISICVFTYSTIYKLLGEPSNLPHFPFYPYIIAYACLILLVQFSRFSPLLLIVVLINFGVPSFRGTFFSHFGSTIWMIIVTIMFILSNIASLFIFFNSLVQRLALPKSSSMKREIGILPSLFLTIVLYFGLISPFYLGTIKPGPFHKGVEPEIYRVDHVFEEVITAKSADRQTARQYLLDGKRKAALGNKAGFVDSIQFYKMALELIPNFSTSYAEMAYSYASIGRILKEAKDDSGLIKENFRMGREAISIAYKHNPDNPTVYGVKAILEYFMGNKDEAQNDLKRAISLAEEGGYSDRVLQAMAILEKKKKKKIEYLLGIQVEMEKHTDNLELRDLYRNSAELHNLLGISYYQIGNKTKATLLFERAIRLNPKYGEAYLNLALVYSTKDRPKLYKNATEKDPNFRHVANYYSKLWNVQKWLRRFYLFLLALFVVKLFIFSSRGFDPRTNTIRPEYLHRMKTMFLRYVLIFICTYGIFELYIHILHPINTISHMFPVKFPFF